MKQSHIFASAILLFAPSAFAEEGNISMLNELVGGEISAVETYEQVLDKVGTTPGAETLRDIAKNHQLAVDTLQEYVTKEGGRPVQSSGAWGTWAKTVVGSAKIIGDKTALKALKEGEEHGIKEYQEALSNKNVTQDAKDVIRNKLIPNQQKHIEILNTMMPKM